MALRAVVAVTGKMPPLKCPIGCSPRRNAATPLPVVALPRERTPHVVAIPPERPSLRLWFPVKGPQSLSPKSLSFCHGLPLIAVSVLGNTADWPAWLGVGAFHRAHKPSGGWGISWETANHRKPKKDHKPHYSTRFNGRFLLFCGNLITGKNWIRSRGIQFCGTTYSIKNWVCLLY